MPSWPAFRHQHLHRSSRLCTPLPESSTTLNQYDHVTPTHKKIKPCIGFQSSRGLSSSCVSAAPFCHQQSDTCLHTESPDNYCIRVRSGLKPLGQQQRSTRLKLGERAFSVVGPRVWNQLPNDLKAITDTRVLGANLKIFFFKFSSAYL